MKKLFAVLFVAICVLGFASCKKDEKPDPNNDTKEADTASVNKAVEDLKASVDTFGISDLVLPTEQNGCKVEWISSDAKTVTDEGRILRRSKNKKDVLFTVNVSKNDVTSTFQMTFTIYPKDYGFIAREFLSNIPGEISEDCDTIFTDFYKYYNVTWSSSNPELFDETGKYTKPENDTEITLRFRVSVDEKHYKDFEAQVMVIGITPEERMAMVKDYLITGPLSELNVNTDLNLPDVCPEANVELVWSTSNENIISKTGKVTQYVYERYCYLYCTFTINGNVSELKFKMSVVPLDISKMTEEEIIKNWADSIAVSELNRIKMIGYGDFVQSFNRLYFFNNVLDPRNQQIVPQDKEHPQRPGKKDPSIGTQLIVVHDTANQGSTANAKAHANFVNAVGTEVSFQYVVGNDGVYHMIPDDEVSWHAGDGSRKFGMNDTGVKAHSRVCTITLTDDGYFAFNGVKGKIRIPDGAQAGLSTMVDNGILCEVGPNGNYWLNNNYYNGGYGKIANMGGNQNSIGIETCVNKGSDYLLTIKNLANLVAQLLMENNLPISRVMQHNNMSGKDCPHAIRASDQWQAFLDEISCNRFFNTHFKDITVIWTPKTAILGVDGRIKKDITGYDKIEYSVTIKRGDTVIYGQNYTTKLVTGK